MIKGFKGKAAQAIFEGRKLPKGVPADIASVARRKLVMLSEAEALADLAAPGNRLEQLKGWLRSYHSIRVNNQWRIVFRWTEAGPDEVAIGDYHQSGKGKWL